MLLWRDQLSILTRSLKHLTRPAIGNTSPGSELTAAPVSPSPLLHHPSSSAGLILTGPESAPFGHSGIKKQRYGKAYSLHVTLHWDEVAPSLARSSNLIPGCPDSRLAKIARLGKIKQSNDLTTPSSLVYVCIGHHSPYVGPLGYDNLRPPRC